jgi:glycosyltransferase involved in cell wall biosynthesis
VRVLHISSARSLGGGERHLVELAQALSARGHEVHVALRPGSPLREKLTALQALNFIELPLQNALDIRSALGIGRAVRERRIEIVHAHMARDYPLAALATRRQPQARLIITRHVMFPLKRLHALALAHVSRVIAVSAPVARALSERKIFPARKISVVPNGIALERFEQTTREASRAAFARQLNISPERLLVGTLGEINPLKGQAEFLRAALLIAERQPQADFIIAGRDRSEKGEHRAALAPLLSAPALRGRVHLTGWIDDVAPFLKALDVFVSASHTESFGLAIVEAMASGTAIVATMTPGACSVIEDGVSGKLVPLGDVEALAANLDGLLSNSKERKRLSAHALEQARERFSLERMVRATEQIYFAALRGDDELSVDDDELSA